MHTKLWKKAKGLGGVDSGEMTFQEIKSNLTALGPRPPSDLKSLLLSLTDITASLAVSMMSFYLRPF